MPQQEQIVRVCRWLLVIPAVWFVNGWFYIAATSILIILFIPIESIFIDHSLTGNIVCAVSTYGLYFLSCFAASCSAYAIAPSHKLRTSLASIMAICLNSALTIWLAYKYPAAYPSVPGYQQQSVLIFVTQIAVLCLTANVLNPSRFLRIIGRLAPAGSSRSAFTWVAIQTIFCCIGWSMEIIDFAPSARKVSTPVFLLFSLAVPIIFAFGRTGMAPKLKQVSLMLCLISIFHIAVTCCWLPSIMSYHDPTPEERKRLIDQDKQLDEQLYKQNYVGDPKAIASAKILSAISKYEELHGKSKPIREILEIGKLGGTIGEIPAKHRIRQILATAKEPSELIGAAKAMHNIMKAEATTGGDHLLWQLTWHAMWECVRRATEFRGSTGAAILATIRSDVAGTDTANSRAFDNYECRQKKQPPKWSKDEVMMPDDDP